MTQIDQYVKAATRDNTRKAYQGAVRHFEVEWSGFLPATAESVARYLVDHAETLSVNTLRQRLGRLRSMALGPGLSLLGFSVVSGAMSLPGCRPSMSKLCLDRA